MNRFEQLLTEALSGGFEYSVLEFQDVTGFYNTDWRPLRGGREGFGGTTSNLNVGNPVQIRMNKLERDPSPDDDIISNIGTSWGNLMQIDPIFSKNVSFDPIYRMGINKLEKFSIFYNEEQIGSSSTSKEAVEKAIEYLSKLGNL